MTKPRLRQYPFLIFKDEGQFICVSQFGATQGRTWREARYMMRDFLMCAVESEKASNQEIEIPKDVRKHRKVFAYMLDGSQSARWRERLNPPRSISRFHAAKAR